MPLLIDETLFSSSVSPAAVEALAVTPFWLLPLIVLSLTDPLILPVVAVPSATMPNLFVAIWLLLINTIALELPVGLIQTPPLALLLMSVSWIVTCTELVLLTKMPLPSTPLVLPKP